MTDIRRLVTVTEEITQEGGAPLARPLRRVAVAAVIRNPYAGTRADALDELIASGEELGGMLAERGAAALDHVESYGKGAIVGMGGELEHAAALLHPKLGAPMRAAIGGGTSIIPSAKKRGGPGTPLDVPLHYKDAAFVRTHFDAIEVRIVDAPADDEIIVVCAFTDGGRPHPRVGGLTKEEAKGEDGLR